MQSERRIAPDLPAVPAASDELAEGLMLLRASSLKTIRLQLAIERHDRRVALEAMDDLVALDDELQKVLAGIPAPDDFADLQAALSIERSRLDHEKLGLAAGVITERSQPEPVRLPDPPQPQPPAFVQDAPAFPADEWHRLRYVAEGDGKSPRRRWVWAVAFLTLVTALVAAAYWLGYLEVIRDWALP
jgi:hypothetical protein